MLGYSFTVVFCCLVVTYWHTRCGMFMKGDLEARVVACFTSQAFCYILWRKPSNQEVQLGYDWLQNLESVFCLQFNLPYFHRRVTVPTLNFKVDLAPPESVCWHSGLLFLSCIYFLFVYICRLLQCLSQIIIAWIYIWRTMGLESASYSGFWGNVDHVIFMH
jgi:hypothetical protein